MSLAFLWGGPTGRERGGGHRTSSCSWGHCQPAQQRGENVGPPGHCWDGDNPACEGGKRKEKSSGRWVLQENFEETTENGGEEEGLSLAAEAWESWEKKGI